MRYAVRGHMVRAMGESVSCMGTKVYAYTRGTESESVKRASSGTGRFSVCIYCSRASPSSPV